MCGIAGKLNFAQDSVVYRSEIEAMLRPIHHRGPDGQGVFLDGPIGLGHVRLSIIDVEGGRQPMTNENGTVWIVFNGEIYNFQALHDELVSKGHIFQTRCDTEVIIHLYEEYGDNCLRHLQGMFGFALWDTNRRRLLIARDRVGIKPVYICRTDSTLHFASELKAILADPSVPREIDAPALRQCLSFYYPAGPATLFRSIQKLPPGHFLVVEPGRFEVRQYWDLRFTQDRWQYSYEQAVDELQSLVAETVRSHMIADVPVGVLLSGGVDSSAVLSFAVNGTDKKVKTFTVGFDGGQVVDERPFARLAAQRFGTEHYDLSITAEDFWNFLPAYIWHMEEPVCEPPAVALYYVSKLAKDHVKVLLSGEGGDEAFAGYPNYPNMLALQRVERRLGPLARPAGVLAGMLGALFNHSRFQRYAAALGRPLATHYFSRRSYPATYFHHHGARLLTPGFAEASGDNRAEQFMHNLLKPANNWPLLDQMLYADTKTWLPDDLLIKADKITMANSLELRVPLLDHKVLEFAASLPSEYKIEGRDTKRVLKTAFARVLPQEIIKRKKVGFPVPYDGWFRTTLADRTHDILLSTRSRARGIFNPREVEQILRRHRRSGGLAAEIFTLLAIELWCQRFVDAA